MKLLYADTSPFARKCLVTARELGIHERVELVSVSSGPTRPDKALVAKNPLGKVPTLITDDHVALYDSRVICEYFDWYAQGRLRASHDPTRWTVLADEALADGMMDAAVLARYEMGLRPEALRWKEWSGGQLAKVTNGLVELERRAAHFHYRVDVGTIAIACALGYLDFRYSTLGWRRQFPNIAAWFDRFNARDSMVATRPVETRPPEDTVVARAAPKPARLRQPPPA
jgi:glutathione S-transferase